jgi:N-hydroxyarylamine O-acetyltransferase
MSFDPALYIHRVGLSDTITIDEAGLEEIHRAQLYSIPFENFDIHLGKPINLDEKSLCKKLLQRNRGGYCFELNGLLQIALTHFGFQSRSLLARVHVSGEMTGRNHQLLLVTVAGRDWICDVGFGTNSLRAPIPFELNQSREQDGFIFRLRADETYGYMLQSKMGGAWQNLYSFDFSPVFPVDIELGNFFTSTSPQSFFVSNRVAALGKPDGRTALINFTLREHDGSQEQITDLEVGPSYLGVLQDYFGIDLDASYGALKPIDQH